MLSDHMAMRSHQDDGEPNDIIDFDHPCDDPANCNWMPPPNPKPEQYDRCTVTHGSHLPFDAQRFIGYWWNTDGWTFAFE